MKKIVALSLLLISSSAISAEFTDYIEVNSIQFDGSSENFFVDRVNEASLGAVSCAGATRVMIDSSVTGRKEILSITLSAKMAGKQLKFYGNCSPTVAQYFNAYWVELK